MHHRISLIGAAVLQIAWSVACDAQSAAESWALKQEAVVIRDLALSSYRANYGSLQGVSCRLSQTISLNLDILEAESERDEPVVLEKLAASGINVIPAGQVRPLEPAATTEISGTTSTTSDHVIYFCGDRVRNQRHRDGKLQNVIVRNQDNCICQFLTSGTKRTDRREITDGLVSSGPIIDPRDFGSQSGIGNLIRMLETWKPISARRDVKQRDVDGLIELTLREPVHGAEHAGFINRCVLYIDPHKNHLPVFAMHWDGATLSTVVAISYVRCDWVESPCYLPSACLSLMPTNSKSADVWSEKLSRSTVKSVVTEMVEYPSACAAAAYRIDASGGDYSDSITGTLVHGPNLAAIVDGAASRIADTSNAFKSLSVGMIAILGIVGAILMRASFR